LALRTLRILGGFFFYHKGRKKIPHPVLAFAKTSLSLRKERDVAKRQGEVKNGLALRTLRILGGFFLFTTKGAKKELHETDSKRSEKFKYVLDEP
jgi:hypothetical protein